MIAVAKTLPVFLCAGCNTRLVASLEDPLIVAALAYLAKHNSKEVVVRVAEGCATILGGE